MSTSKNNETKRKEFEEYQKRKQSENANRKAKNKTALNAFEEYQSNRIKSEMAGWQKKAHTLVDSLYNDSQKRGESYQDSLAFSHYYNDNDSKIAELLKEGDQYGQYFGKQGGRYNDYNDAYKETVEYLTNWQSALAKENAHWSQWASEEEYNAAAEMLNTPDWSTYDIDSARADLEQKQATYDKYYTDVDSWRATVNDSKIRLADIERQINRSFGLTSQQRRELENEANVLRSKISAGEEYVSSFPFDFSAAKSDIDKITKEIESAQAWRDQKAREDETNRLYDDIVASPDYEEILQKHESDSFYEGSIGDLLKKTYGAIFNPQNAGNRITAANATTEYDPKTLTSYNSGAKNKILPKFMNEKEQLVYNAYYYRGEYDKAEEYYKSIEGDLEERARSVANTNAAQFAKDKPFWSSAQSVGHSVFGTPIEAAVDLIKYGIDAVKDPTTAKLDRNDMADTVNITRQTVSEDMTPVGRFFYNTTMSGLDSLLSGLAFGNVAGVTLALSAGSSAYNEGLDRGMNGEQAMAYGIASGLFEGIFESLSLGNLNALKEISPKTFKDVAVNIAKSIGVNASEETFTEIANIAYDTLLNGEYSDYQEMIDAGMSKEEALKQFVLRVLEAGASGALMGFGFGGVGSAIGYVNNKGADTVADIQNRMRQSASENQMYISFQNKVKDSKVSTSLTDIVKGREVKDGDLQKVIGNETARSILNETLGTDIKAENSLDEARDIISKAFESSDGKTPAETKIDRARVVKSLEVNLPSEKAESFATIIADIGNGNEVSDKQIASVLNNKYARNALNKYLGRTVEDKFTENSKASEVRAAMAEGDYSRQGQAVLFGSILGMSGNAIKGLSAVVANSHADVASIARAYNVVYKAAKSGKALADVSGVEALSPTQKLIAYEYGVMDGLTSKTETKVDEAVDEAVDEEVVTDTNDGHKTETETVTEAEISRESEVEEGAIVTKGGETVVPVKENTKEQKRIIDMGKKLGVEVAFGKITKKGKNIDGLFDGKVLYINPKTTSGSGAYVLFKHEFTHFLEKSTKYIDFAKEVTESKAFSEWLKKNGFKNSTEYYAKIIADYKQIGKNLELGGAQKEAIANFCAEMLYAKDDSMQRFVDTLSADHKRTFGELIRDFIEWIKKKLGKVDEIAMLEKKYADVFQSKGFDAVNKEYQAAYSFINSSNGMANDALIPYNDKQINYINNRGDYIIDSFDKLVEVVNLAFDEPDKKATAYFGMVDTTTLQKIKNSIPNLPESMDMLFEDNRSYSIATTLDSIRHIVDEKKLTRQDVIDYLDRFADTIVEYDDVDFHYYQGRGRQTPGLMFKKNFSDGKYISFNLISQKKQHFLLQSLYIDSVSYQKRKSANPVLMQNAPASTPKARGGQTSNTSIPQNSDLSTGSSKKTSETDDTQASYTPSERDTEYLDAVNRGDMETAQRMVDEAAKEAGYVPVTRYHQTGKNFTRFSNKNPDAALNDSDTPNGYFFKENNHDIGVGADFVKTGHGGSIQMPVYLKHNNLLYFENREAAQRWYSKHVQGYGDLLREYNEHIDEYRRIDKENTAKMFDELNALVEKGEDTPDNETAVIDKYDKIIDDWIAKKEAYETSLRAKMRQLLNRYFIESDSGYDGIELADDGHRYIDGKREDVHTYIVFKNTQIKSADPVTYDDDGNVIPLSQRFKSENDDIRYSYTPDKEATVDELIAQYKDGRLTEEQFRDALVNKKQKTDPVSLANTKPEDFNTTPPAKRKTGENNVDGERDTIIARGASKLFSEEFKEEAKADAFIMRYKTIKNKDALRKAAADLDENGEDGVRRWFKKPVASGVSLNDVVKGYILLERYKEIGDIEGQVAVAQKLSEMGTMGGQVVQSFTILSRFTPEGMLVYAQRVLNDVRQRMIETQSEAWLKKHAESLKLTDADIEYIYNRTILASQMPDGRDKKIMLAEITSRLLHKIPPAKGQSIKSLQRISMLLNPKTIIRNVLGNATIVPVHWLSDWIGMPLDTILAIKTGQRTKGVKTNVAKDAKASWSGFKYAIEDWLKDINTQENLDRFEINKNGGRSFYEGGRLSGAARMLNAMDRLTSFTLAAGDRPFYEYWFSRSLNSQMAANKVTTPTAEMIETATQEALERTWQDENNVTAMVTKMKGALNTLSIAGYGLGDVFIKFTKTPANLAKAIYDFSPVGFATAARDAVRFSRAVKSGKGVAMAQRNLVKSFSNAAAGTMMYLLAYALFKAGKLSGGSDEDKDVAAFEKWVQGIPAYSFKLFGKWFSYEWMQPVGSVAAIVSDYMEAKDTEGDDKLQPIITALKSGGAVLYNQSFLKSFQTLFTAENIVDGFFEALLDDPSAFVPQIFSQIANVADKNRRTTFDNTSPIKSAINAIKNKIPGLRNTLTEDVDVFGRVVPNSQNNVFDAFFNPANTYTNTSDAVTNHVYDLYKTLGNKGMIPAKAPYSIEINGKKYAFSSEKRARYQTVLGTVSYKIIEGLLGNEIYNSYSPAEQEVVIKAVYEYANKAALASFEDVEIDYDLLKKYNSYLTKTKYESMSDEEKKDAYYKGVLKEYTDILGTDEAGVVAYFTNKGARTAIQNALFAGDGAAARNVLDKATEAISKYSDDEDVVKSFTTSIRTGVTSAMKEEYILAYYEGDDEKMEQIKQMLIELGIYGKSSDVKKTLKAWLEGK